MRPLSAVAWCVLAGCQPVPASSMSDVAFPAGFTLDGRRDVVLDVRVSGEPQPAHLAVRTPDGAALFDGDLAFAATHPLVLVVPGAVGALEVRVGDGARSWTAVPIRDGHATLRVGP